MPAVPETTLRRVAMESIPWSILLIVLGFAAIASPVASSFGAAVVIGWLVFIAGLVQVVHALRSKGIGHIVWKLLIAAIYLVAGAYTIAHPALELAGLTLLLAMFFCAAGTVDIIAWFSTRNSGGSVWMLLNGMLGLALGFTIWSRWPATSVWFLGSLVGICLFMAGMARLMMSLAIQRYLRDPGSSPFHERRAA